VMHSYDGQRTKIPTAQEGFLGRPGEGVLKGHHRAPNRDPSLELRDLPAPQPDKIIIIDTRDIV